MMILLHQHHFMITVKTDEGQVYVYHGNSGCLDLPDVTLNFSDDIICSNDGAILLTDGSPSGGFYTALELWELIILIRILQE